MIDFSIYTNEELKLFSENIKQEINSRLKKILKDKKEIEEILNEEYTFDFYSESRNKMPFVAKCLYNNKEYDNIERIFKNLEKTKGNREIIISGKYTAKENEILDIRNQEGRYYYIVLESKLVKIGSPEIAKEIIAIKQFLKGEIEINTLLELNGVKEVETGVLDELKD